MKNIYGIYIIYHIYRYTPLCRAWLFLQPNSLIKHNKPTGPTAISTFATNLLAYGRRDSDEDTAPKRFDPTQWSHTNLGRKPRKKPPWRIIYVLLGRNVNGLLLKNDGLKMCIFLMRDGPFSLAMLNFRRDEDVSFPTFLKLRWHVSN